MEKTVFEYRDKGRNTELSLTLTPEGIVLYHRSDFEEETDTYVSKPFSIADFSRALREFSEKGEYQVSELGQSLQIRKNRTGDCTFSIDGGDYKSNFVISGLPFNVEAVSKAIEETGSFV